jgi:DNA polymerase III epsilon subunit-like protein
VVVVSKGDKILNVYIDLEATQFGREIISFGAVAENGAEFYTLVRPKHLDKITKFITKLTGLSPEMYSDETPNIDVVANQFMNWCREQTDEKLRFFSFGNFDKVLFEAESERYPDNEGLKRLSKKLCNLCVVSGKILYHSTSTPSLKKVYEDVVGKEIEQTHNALDDAKMLMEIHKYIIDTPIGVFIDFEEDYLVHKYVKKWRKKRDKNKALRKYLNSLCDLEIEQLQFKDIKKYVGTEYIESRIREDYFNLTGKNWSDKYV